MKRWCLFAAIGCWFALNHQAIASGVDGLAFSRHDVNAKMEVFDGFQPATLESRYGARRELSAESTIRLTMDDPVLSVAQVGFGAMETCSVANKNYACSAKIEGPGNCSAAAGNEWKCSAMQGSDQAGCSVGIDDENHHCSADKPGGGAHCSVYVENGQPKPCSVSQGSHDPGTVVLCSTNQGANNGGYDGWCSASGQNDGFCSARGTITDCSVNTDTHDETVYCSAKGKGVCSTKIDANDQVCSIKKFDRPANCSVSQKVGEVQCSTYVEQSACSIAQGAYDGAGEAFCSVNASAGASRCSTFNDQNATGMELCSVILDAQGNNADKVACSVRESGGSVPAGAECTAFGNGNGAQCSTIPLPGQGGVHRCSVVKEDGTVTGPVNGKCPAAGGGHGGHGGPVSTNKSMWIAFGLLGMGVFQFGFREKTK